MSASYPSAAKNFTVKTDGTGQFINAAHVNDLQDEVTAIETGLIDGLAHDVKPTVGATNTKDLGVAGAVWRDLNLGRNAAVGGTLGVTGNTTLGGTLGVTGAATFSAGISAAAQPRCSAYADAAQSVNDSTDTYLTLNQEDYDVGTMHDLVTNNTRVTVPVGGGGLYLIRGGTSFAADADGYRELFLRKNGTTKMTAVRYPSAGGAVTTGVEISQVLVLAAGDYLELGVAHTAGAALDVGSATRAASSHLQLVKLW